MVELKCFLLPLLSFRFLMSCQVSASCDRSPHPCLVRQGLIIIFLRLMVEKSDCLYLLCEHCSTPLRWRVLSLCPTNILKLHSALDRIRPAFGANDLRENTWTPHVCGQEHFRCMLLMFFFFNFGQNQVKYYLLYATNTIAAQKDPVIIPLSYIIFCNTMHIN